MSEKREHFRDYEEKGKEMSGTDEYVKARERYQSVRLTPLDYGGSGEARLTASEKFRVQNFLPVIDQYQTSLNQRLKAYENTCSLFGFLRKLDSLECNEIEAAARKLVDEYKDDLDPALSGELMQFTAFFTEFLLEEDDNIGREHFLYKLLLKK